MKAYTSVILISYLVFIVCMLIEIATAKIKKIRLHSPKACLASAIIFFIRTGCEYGLFLPMIIYMYQLFDIHLPQLDNKLHGFLYWFFLFIAQDFLYYWFHRTAHYVSWIWACHGVHHSDNDYNFFTPLRETPFVVFGGAWIFFMPLILLGFNLYHILLVIYLSLIFQFFLHTQLIHRCPTWVEFVLNTPSSHRVHHAREAQYLNKNFGGVLIIWDRLFNSFEIETAPPNYGWIIPYRSNNPFAIIFRPWITMFQSVLKYKNLKYLIFFPDDASNSAKKN